MKSAAELRAMMDANRPEIDSVFRGAYFAWSWAGCGFGQLSFDKDATGALRCMNECMGRESVRKLLYALADHVADTAVLDDEPRPAPPPEPTP